MHIYTCISKYMPIYANILLYIYLYMHIVVC